MSGPAWGDACEAGADRRVWAASEAASGKNRLPGHVGRKDGILRAEGFSGHGYQIEFAPRYIPANSSPIATAVTTIVREVSLVAPDRMAVTQDLAIVSMAKSLSRIADPSLALSVAPPDLGPTARRARKREQGKPIVT